MLTIVNGGVVRQQSKDMPIFEGGNLSCLAAYRDAYQLSASLSTPNSLFNLVNSLRYQHQKWGRKWSLIEGEACDYHRCFSFSSRKAALVTLMNFAEREIREVSRDSDQLLMLNHLRNNLLFYRRLASKC